jgi:hypothetical protein
VIRQGVFEKIISSHPHHDSMLARLCCTATANLLSQGLHPSFLSSCKPQLDITRCTQVPRFRLTISTITINRDGPSFTRSATCAACDLLNLLLFSTTDRRLI